jgi:DNA modification methylase
VKKKNGQITWRHDQRRLGDLVPWEHNPRQIGKEQAARLLDSLDKFGQIHPIAIGPQNQIYDGHQRDAVWAASNKYGPKYEVDVRIANRALTDKERAQLVVYLHKGAAGEFDFDALANLPETDIADLVAWGFDEAELLGSSTESPSDDSDAEPDVERAEELNQKWKVNEGDLWQVGEHRLVCGDSSNVDHVERLMGGEQGDFLVTSPPYNVGVNYSSHDDKQVGWAQYEAFLCAVLDQILPRIKDGRAIAWNIGTSPKTHHVRQHLLFEDRYGLKYYRQMVWKKVGVPVPLWYNTTKNPVARRFTPNYQHEVVLIFTKGDIELGAAIEIDELCENDVFEYGQQFATTDLPSGPTRTGAQSNLDRRSHKAHPAAFPIRIPSMFISHLSALGEIVIEPFSGAGSTMVACENRKRKCFAMEIDKLYCAVTLERMQTAFPEINIARA